MSPRRRRHADAGGFTAFYRLFCCKTQVTLHMAAQQKPLAIASILDSCAGATRKDFAPGTILLSEGDTSGRLYGLADGTVEVLRGDTQVAVIRGAGSIFG